nr:hypothetical protein [Tanacetum cinerariifolium]
MGGKPKETVIEQSGQSKEVIEPEDLEETEDEEEILLIQRQTGVVIGRQAHKVSNEENLDESMKMKGIEMLSTTT